MGEIASYTIAGVTLTLQGEAGLAWPPAPLSFAAFRGAAGDERLLLRLAAGEPPAAKGERLFASPPVWSLYRAGRGLLFEMFAHRPPRRRSLFVAGPPAAPRLDFQGSDRDPFAGPALELLFVLQLAACGGLLLHGCAVARAGRGVLFLGESGAGKSTIARLIHRAGRGEILSDDRAVVRPDGRGGFLLYGTPWHGEAAFAAAGGVPLAALFLLRHGRENRLHRLPRAASVTHLMQCAFPPLWEREATAETLRRLDELAAAVPFRVLEFFPDRRVFALIDGLC